eukprot:TRINITY_DN1265_c0_g1_i1.p1 TRINITY_DN1265_c0_g1~~TRINITY_DN1265_c0_g1_i1.p1  ORF type:complete len:299 (+),score=90.49 TRINITY_DN1265_c0_g1_i1:71-967(+)
MGCVGSQQKDDKQEKLGKGKGRGREVKDGVEDDSKQEVSNPLRRGSRRSQQLAENTVATANTGLEDRDIKDKQEDSQRRPTDQDEVRQDTEHTAEDDGTDLTQQAALRTKMETWISDVEANRQYFSSNPPIPSPTHEDRQLKGERSSNSLSLGNSGNVQSFGNVSQNPSSRKTAPSCKSLPDEEASAKQEEAAEVDLEGVQREVSVERIKEESEEKAEEEAKEEEEQDKEQKEQEEREEEPEKEQAEETKEEIEKPEETRPKVEDDGAGQKEAAKAEEASGKQEGEKEEAKEQPQEES